MTRPKQLRMRSRSALLAMCVVRGASAAPPAATEQLPPIAQPPAVQPPAVQPPLAGRDSALPPEADERYLRAVALYDEGDYDAALRELERVYTLAPMYSRVLYNMGIVSLALRDHARAMSYLERYLAEAGDTIEADLRAEISGKLRSLAERVAFVTIDVNVAGAEVSVDDVPVGASPIPGPVRVNAGSRRITAQRPGQLPASRVIGLAAGVEARVTLTLAEARPDAEPIAPMAPASIEPERPFPWLAWGGTALLTGAAVYCTSRAFALQDQYEHQQSQLGVTRTDLDQLDRRAFTFSVAADTLAIAALAGAGYSLYLTFWSKPPPSNGNGASQRSLKLELGMQQARLSGSF